MEYIQYIIIIIFLLLVALGIVYSKNRDFKIKANKLVDYLGGKDNIINHEFSKSRFIVEVKDVTVVNKDAIQKLGAKGIVEVENQLKIVLGENAKQIKALIKDLK